MTLRRAALVAAVVVAGIVAAVLLLWEPARTLEDPGRPSDPEPPPAPLIAAPAPPTAHITATLFYAAPGGQALVPVRREVPLGSDVVAQGSAIIETQLEPPPEPYTPLIPEGTTLRAFYVTPRGDAFVDLSAEISNGHPGGSLTELLTVYAIVNALTSNLPDVRRVQILVDGREVDTIAGHVDIRRPLARNTSLVARPPAEAP